MSKPVNEKLRKHIVLCPHCSKEILDHMKICPFCKEEQPEHHYHNALDKEKLKRIKTIIYIVLTALAIGLYIYIAIVK